MIVLTEIDNEGCLEYEVVHNGNLLCHIHNSDLDEFINLIDKTKADIIIEPLYK